MTQKYIRTAEAVGEVIGAVFPPLPESLAAGRYRQEYRPGDAQLTETIVEAPGIEPGSENFEATCVYVRVRPIESSRFARTDALSSGLVTCLVSPRPR